AHRRECFENFFCGNRIAPERFQLRDYIHDAAVAPPSVQLFWFLGHIPSLNPAKVLERPPAAGSRVPRWIRPGEAAACRVSSLAHRNMNGKNVQAGYDAL